MQRLLNPGSLQPNCFLSCKGEWLVGKGLPCNMKHVWFVTDQSCATFGSRLVLLFCLSHPPSLDPSCGVIGGRVYIWEMQHHLPFFLLVWVFVLVSSTYQIWYVYPTYMVWITTVTQCYFVPLCMHFNTTSRYLCEV